MWQIEILILLTFVTLSLLILFVAPYLEKDKYSAYEISGESLCVNGTQDVYHSCTGLTIPDLGKPCVFNKSVGYDTVITSQKCVSSSLPSQATITTTTDTNGITKTFSCPEGHCTIKTQTGERILLGGLHFSNFKGADITTRRFTVKSVGNKYFINGVEMTQDEIVHKDRTFIEFTPHVKTMGVLQCPSSTALNFIQQCPADVLMPATLKINGQCMPPGTCDGMCTINCINFNSTLAGYVLGDSTNLYAGVNKIPVLINKNIVSLCGVSDTLTSTGAIFYPYRGKSYVILSDNTSGWWNGLDQELTDETSGLGFDLDDFEILNNVFGWYNRDSRCMGL